MQLPYRPCVGILLVDRSGLVCVGQRLPECSMVATPADSWHMPQGSIAPSEPAREVALRVLDEDLGISEAQILAEAPGWFTYELPADMIGVALKGRYCGKKFKWVAARVAGAGDGLGLRPRKGVRAWQWVPAVGVPRRAPLIEREIYEDVVATFAPLLPAPISAAPSGQSANAAGLQAASLPWFVTLFG